MGWSREKFFEENNPMRKWVDDNDILMIIKVIQQLLRFL